MKTKILVPIILFFSIIGFIACPGAYGQKKDYIVKLSTATYDKETEKGIVLVDFWAKWCAPCRKMNPVLEELAKEYDGKIKIAKFDVDSDKRFSSNKGIQVIPTMVFYYNGKELGRVKGSVEKGELEKTFDELISTYTP